VIWPLAPRKTESTSLVESVEPSLVVTVLVSVWVTWESSPEEESFSVSVVVRVVVSPSLYESDSVALSVADAVGRGQRGQEP
jgi:hypothetical protein